MRRIATVRKAKWKSLETLQTCGCVAFCTWRHVCHSLADSARTGRLLSYRRCAKEPRWFAVRVAAQVTLVSCGMSWSSGKQGPIAAAKCSSEPRPKCNTCGGPPQAVEGTSMLFSGHVGADCRLYALHPWSILSLPAVCERWPVDQIFHTSEHRGRNQKCCLSHGNSRAALVAWRVLRTEKESMRQESLHGTIRAPGILTHKHRTWAQIVGSSLPTLQGRSGNDAVCTELGGICRGSRPLDCKNTAARWHHTSEGEVRLSCGAESPSGMRSKNPQCFAINWSNLVVTCSGCGTGFRILRPCSDRDLDTSPFHTVASGLTCTAARCIS